MLDFKIDGVSYSQPKGWEVLEERLYYAQELDGYLLEITGTLTFDRDAYQYLRTQFLSSTCGKPRIEIYKEDEGGNMQRIFDGQMFLNDATWNLTRKEVECEVVDNSFISLIDNNKTIKAYLNVEKSKNGEDISSQVVTQGSLNVLDVTGGVLYLDGEGVRIFDAFTTLIAFMTDAQIGFRSEYFDPANFDPTVTGDSIPKFSCLMTGEQLRQGGQERFPYISFEQLYTDMKRQFNLAFDIETDSTGIYIRIEPKSYFRRVSSGITLDGVTELKQRLSKEDFYAKILFGSNEFTSADTFFPNTQFLGWNEEEYHLLGQCNSSNLLDLGTDEIITDSNVIQDVAYNSTTSNDQDIFLVYFDETDTTVQYLKPGSATDYYFNQPFNNANVALRWFGNVPNPIALFLGNGNDGFLAEYTIAAAQVFTDVAPLEPVRFDNDYTAPNNDPNNNYGNGTAQGSPVSAANSRYTAPLSGTYSLKASIWAEVEQQITIHNRIGIRLKRYDSGNNFIESQESAGPPIVGDSPTLGNNFLGFHSYEATFYLDANDYIVVECYSADIFGGPTTIPGDGIFRIWPEGGDTTGQAGKSLFETTAFTTGGGIFQTYDERDVQLIENQFPFPIDVETWEDMKLNSFSLMRIFYEENKYVDGFMNEVSRNVVTGLAECSFNSKLVDGTY